MATYTFKCENCGNIEVNMSMKDYKPLEECPKCKGKVERVYKPITSIWNCGGAFGKSGGN